MPMKVPRLDCALEGRLIIKRIVTGVYCTNCYVLYHDGEALVIDPGGDPETILSLVTKVGTRVTQIVATHAHYDHLAGVEALRELTGAKFALHALDAAMAADPVANRSLLNGAPPVTVAADRFLAHGDVVRVGAHELHVLHTPGHSPGGICLFGGNSLFSGDILFRGSVGETGFANASAADLLNSLRMLLSLPGDVKVLPGHGFPSTMEREAHTIQVYQTSLFHGTVEANGMR